MNSEIVAIADKGRPWVATSDWLEQTCRKVSKISRHSPPVQIGGGAPKNGDDGDGNAPITWGQWVTKNLWGLLPGPLLVWNREGLQLGYQLSAVPANVNANAKLRDANLVVSPSRLWWLPNLAGGNLSAEQVKSRLQEVSQVAELLAKVPAHRGRANTLIDLLTSILNDQTALDLFTERLNTSEVEAADFLCQRLGRDGQRAWPELGDDAQYLRFAIENLRAAHNEMRQLVATTPALGKVVAAILLRHNIQNPSDSLRVADEDLDGIAHTAIADYLDKGRLDPLQRPARVIATLQAAANQAIADGKPQLAVEWALKIAELEQALTRAEGLKIANLARFQVANIVQNAGALAPSTNSTAPQPALSAYEKLQNLIGQSMAKAQVDQIITVAETNQRRRKVGAAEPNPITNLIFSGPSGTGKTTVAELLAEILYGKGIIAKNKVLKVTRANLVGKYAGETAINTRAAVDKAVGGILFIDEAYALASDKDSNIDSGREIVETLLSLMDDHKDDLIIVMAGYRNEMNKLMRTNSGLLARMAYTVEFTDFTKEELWQVFHKQSDDNRLQLADGVRERFMELVNAKGTGGRTFGNARWVVNEVFNPAWARQSERLAPLDDSQDTLELWTTILPEDLPPIRAQRQDAIASIDDMIGLAKVKEQFHNWETELAWLGPQREAGLRAAEPSRNLVFYGPPGTGKSEVARLVAEKLRTSGVVSRGHVVQISESSLAEPWKSAATLLEEFFDEARGGVLFIDEAYFLADPQMRPALTRLVELIENNREVVVIVAGYKKKLDTLFAANEGLRGRFPYHIEFTRYNNDELVEIFASLAKRQGYSFDNEVLTAVRRSIPAEKPETFENARWVRTTLENKIAPAIRTRLSQETAANPEQKPKPQDLLRITVADVPKPARGNNGPIDSLDDMPGLSKVKDRVAAITQEIRVDKMREDLGLETSSETRMHQVFVGPPGTAKSSVARYFAHFLGEIGVLPSNTIKEVRGAELVSKWVGESGERMRELFEDAKDGVLFIDEAYELGRPMSNDQAAGHGALAELTALLTDNPRNPVVILAGYPAEMQGLLDTNPGLRRRFNAPLEFPGYTDDELIEIFEWWAAQTKPPLTLEDGVLEAVRKLIPPKSARTESFGNGGWGTNVLAETMRNQSSRIATMGNVFTALPADDKRLMLSTITVSDVPTSFEDGQSKKPMGFGAY